MSDQNPAPGWYPAPHANNEQRYWDGAQWIEPPGSAHSHDVAVADKRARGLALAALIVGIVAFLAGLLPVVGLLIGLTAVALGVVAIVKKQPKGLAITGIVLGAIALITSIAMTAGVANLASNPRPRPAAVESSEPSAAPSETPSSAPTEATSEKPSEPPAEPSAPAEEPSAPPASSGAPDQGSFVTMDERGWALIAKDPDANAGTNVVLFGTITQFDSATGNCAMLVKTSAVQKEMSYEYDQSVMAVSGDWEAECPTFDPLVEGDHVQLWATVTQSFSYDTQIGGNTTVPMVEVWYAQLLPATEY